MRNILVEFNKPLGFRYLALVICLIATAYVNAKEKIIEIPELELENELEEVLQELVRAHMVKDGSIGIILFRPTVFSPEFDRDIQVTFTGRSLQRHRDHWTQYAGYVVVEDNIFLIASNGSEDKFIKVVDGPKLNVVIFIDSDPPMLFERHDIYLKKKEAYGYEIVMDNWECFMELKNKVIQ